MRGATVVFEVLDKTMFFSYPNVKDLQEMSGLCTFSLISHTLILRRHIDLNSSPSRQACAHSRTYQETFEALGMVRFATHLSAFGCDYNKGILIGSSRPQLKDDRNDSEVFHIARGDPSMCSSEPSVHAAISIESCVGVASSAGPD